MGAVLMLGPGNDNGDPDAILELGYDTLMSHMTPQVGKPLAGIIALHVGNEDGDTGVFLWKYGMRKPSVVMAAISDDPRERLTAIGAAMGCAVRVAEEKGLTVAG